jgi:hypothetical protein
MVRGQPECLLRRLLKLEPDSQKPAELQSSREAGRIGSEFRVSTKAGRSLPTA